MANMQKKLQRKREKKQKEEKAAELLATKQEIDRLIAEEKYADAVDMIAESVAKKQIDADLAYKLAYCYFVTGDFDRCGSWIDNTFIYDPNHKDARLLLGRLCLIRERKDDAFAVFDFILENYADVLTDEDKETIDDSLFAYRFGYKEKIMAHYPFIAKFLYEEMEEKESAADTSDEKPVDKAVDKIAGNDVTEATDTDAEVINGVEVKADAADDGVIDGVEIAEETAALEEQTDAEAEAPKETPDVLTATRVVTVSDITEKNISLMDKIKLLNFFAAANFIDNKNDKAEEFLSAALQIDANFPATLKNMAVLHLEMGEKDKALTELSKLQIPDFMILRELRKNG